MSMKAAFQSTKEWVLVGVILLLIPIPIVLVWMLLDGVTYWSWSEAVKLSGFTYCFEFILLIGGLVKAHFEPDRDDEDVTS